MAKDPAFLFYSSDFLSGISDLTMEERGQYITMLCLQHQKGVLNEKTIRLNVGNVSVCVLEKFSKDQDGNFFNKRLVLEIEKRANFIESRRNNGSKGGRPKKETKPNVKPNVKPKKNHIEDENINENIDINNNKSPLEKKIDEFYQFRIKLKKPILEESKEAFIKKLTRLSGNDDEIAIEILDDSIANGWQGIFELKEKPKQNGKQESKFGAISSGATNIALKRGWIKPEQR